MCLLSIDVPFSETAWPCSDVPFPGLMCLRAPTKYVNIRYISHIYLFIQICKQNLWNYVYYIGM